MPVCCSRQRCRRNRPPTMNRIQLHKLSRSHCCRGQGMCSRIRHKCIVGRLHNLPSSSRHCPIHMQRCCSHRQSRSIHRQGKMSHPRSTCCSQGPCNHSRWFHMCIPLYFHKSLHSNHRRPNHNSKCCTRHCCYHSDHRQDMTLM